MTYLQPSNRKFAHKRKRTKIALVCVGFLFAIFLFYPQTLVHTLSVLISPFWSIEDFTQSFVGRSFSILRSKYSLVLENEQLKKENNSFQALQLAFLELEKQNSLLNGNKINIDAFVTASVLRKPPYSVYDTMLVDKGTDQGVALGNKVYSTGSLFIGEVIEVYPASAKIVFASSPDKKTLVVLGDKGVQFEAIGQGGGNLMLKVPSQFEIKKGDVIKLPGSVSHLFGIVEDIEIDSSESIQSVYFKMPVNIFELNSVSIQTVE